MLVSFSSSEQCFEFFAVYPVPVLRDHKGYCYSRRDITNALTNSLSFSLVMYLRMRSTDGPDGVSCFPTRLVCVVCQ